MEGHAQHKYFSKHAGGLIPDLPHAYGQLVPRPPHTQSWEHAVSDRDQRPCVCRPAGTWRPASLY